MMRFGNRKPRKSLLTSTRTMKCSFFFQFGVFSVLLFAVNGQDEIELLLNATISDSSFTFNINTNETDVFTDFNATEPATIKVIPIVANETDTGINATEIQLPTQVSFDTHLQSPTILPIIIANETNDSTDANATEPPPITTPTPNPDEGVILPHTPYPDMITRLPQRHTPGYRHWSPEDLSNPSFDVDPILEEFQKDRYAPSILGTDVNKTMFHEFTRLSKLTKYMLLDPMFAEDYAQDRLSPTNKILFIVFGDIVKHLYANELQTQTGLPERKNRIRYRIRSRNNRPPKQCSEPGRETLRLFCPFSYGYQWWDCLMPDEVCDGIPHCGLGDDEDPKMCMYFKAAVSKIDHVNKAFQSEKNGKDVRKKKPINLYNPI